MDKSSKIGSFCLAAILLGALNANAALVDILAELSDAGRYAVFSMSGTFQNDSLVTINGDAAVGPNGSANIAAPSTINGTLYKDPTATVSGPGKITGGIVTTNLQQAVNDAISASNAFANMPATQMFSSLSTATTIHGNGGNNVISLSGSINLGGSDNLTLNGTANDRFIFNILGGLTLTGSSSVVLTGGVTANDVAFNFIGGGSSISTHVGNTISGILLAPQRDMTLDGTFFGKLIGGGSTLTLMSGAIVNDVTVVPEVTPGSVIFGFLGLVVAIASRRAIARQPQRARARKRF